MGKEGRCVTKITQKFLSRIGGLGLFEKILEKWCKRSAVRIEPFTLGWAFHKMCRNPQVFFTSIFERFLDQNPMDGVGGVDGNRGIKSFSHTLLGSKQALLKIGIECIRHHGI